MTDTEQAPTTGVATGRYRLIANAIVNENPDAAGRLVDVTGEHTRYDEAVDRIVLEALLGISFGLVGYVDPEHRGLVGEVARLFALRINGTNPDPDLWAFYREAVESANNATTADGPQKFAIEGVLHAVVDNVDGPLYTVARVIHLWDDRVPGQHSAVITWLTDTIVDKTKRAGEAHNGREADTASTAPEEGAADARGAEGDQPAPE